MWNVLFISYLLFDLFSQDLCQLVNADAPYWLVGMTEMTRTFGLELLESVLNDFPQVFLQVSHLEYFATKLIFSFFRYFSRERYVFFPHIKKGKKL